MRGGAWLLGIGDVSMTESKYRGGAAPVGAIQRMQRILRMVDWDVRNTVQPEPVTVADLRAQARKRLPRMVFDFVDGAADREQTLRANTEDFARVLFRPKTFTDVSDVDIATEVLGTRLPAPVILGPAGLPRLVRRDAELALARAAHDFGTVFTLSTASSYTIEEAADASGGGVRWFQLYLGHDRAETENLVRRADRAGYGTLVVTADVPVNGQRLRDAHNGMSIPPKVTLRSGIDSIRHLRWLLDIVSDPAVGFRNFDDRMADPTLSHAGLVNQRLTSPGSTWADLDWIRDLWPGKLLIKGILDGETAREAIRHGADGVVVSNHGGRQLDSVRSSISSLVEVRSAIPPEGTLLIDGGVRSGADIAKALALGADAVLIGRPWVWALAADGQRGVAACLRILAEDLVRTLRLLGVQSVRDLGTDVVRIPPEWSGPESGLHEGERLT